MTFREPRPTWPFVLLLVGLFILAALAPRGWRKTAEQPAEPLVVEQTEPSAELVFSSAAPAESEAQVERETPTAEQTTASEASGVARTIVNLPMLGDDEGPQPTLADPPPAVTTTTIRVESSSDRLAARPARPSETTPVHPQDIEAATTGDQAQADANAGEEVEPWREPRDVRERLVRLRDDDRTAPWASNLLDLLDQLTRLGGPHAPGAGRLLERLHDVNNEAERVALRVGDEQTSEQVRRASYGLRRRLPVWQEVASIPREAAPVVATAPPQRERLLACLTNLDEVTKSAPQGEGWRQYLMFDNLRELAQDDGVPVERRRRLAREVLARINARRMTMKQRRFMTAHPLLSLRSELKQWAAEPANLDEFLVELENYEDSGRPSDAELVASHWRQFAGSDAPTAQRLARNLEDNYRGANIRIVLTDSLLTRMMPSPEPRDEFIRETILGVPTSGTSHTETQLAVRLVPDPKRLRFILEANGQVHARTSCKATGATLCTGMNSTYQIQKPFEFSMQGLRTEASEADAQTRTHLRGVDTPISGVPLLGSLVDDFVRKQYSERRSSAEQELRRKVIRRAYAEMDGQVEERLAKSNQQLQERVLTPLARLQLEPAAVGMETSAERLTLRLRLAGEHQLGAHTPRPRAPSDSLASIQIHESAFNNLVSQLDLNGRTFSQADLMRWVADRLNRPVTSVPENIREDVYLTFAPNDAFRVRIKDERIELALTLDELRAEGTTYRDFTVKVCYAPDHEGRTGDLVRDGVVQLIGKRVTTKGQIALRGIFSKTFPREKRFSLLPKRFTEDSQLSDVGVTQVVLNDGWLGIALGPTRVAGKQTTTMR